MKPANLMMTLLIALGAQMPDLEILQAPQAARHNFALLLPGNAFVIAAPQFADALRLRETPHRRSNPKAVPAYQLNLGEKP